MDWTHLHLALNHVPVVGTPFLLSLLMWGWWRGSAEITRLALWWLVGLAAMSVALKFTGDFAAEQAGPKLDPVRAFVDRHEQSADQATTAVFLLGLSAALALFLGRRGRPVPKWALALVTALAVLTCLLLARTANLGGQIGHPTLRVAGLPVLALARHAAARPQLDAIRAAVLAELVPRFLDRMPTDPLTGDPLRYLRAADGSIKLHSVGADGHDDGGELEQRADPSMDDELKRNGPSDWAWPVVAK